MRRTDISWSTVLPGWSDHDLDCMEDDIRTERARRKQAAVTGQKMGSKIIGDSQMSHYLSDRPPDGD